MVAIWNICIVIWPNICASKEQFGIEIHQNLVKIRKKMYTNFAQRTFNKKTMTNKLQRQ